MFPNNSKEYLKTSKRNDKLITYKLTLTFKSQTHAGLGGYV